MNLKRNLIFFFVCSCLLGNEISAQTITAINSDYWSLSTTWDLGRKPQPGDSVVIDGFMIEVDESAQVAQIKLLNVEDRNTTSLSSAIGAGGVLAVTGDIIVTASASLYPMIFQISGQDSVNVGGDLIFTRTIENVSDNAVQLKMTGQGKLGVQGNFQYNFLNSGSFEMTEEVSIQANSKLYVYGNANFELKGGEDFSVVFSNSASVDIKQNVNVQVTGGNNFLFDVDKFSTVKIRGNYSMSNNNTAVASSDAELQVGNNGADLIIEGDLNLTSLYDDHGAKFSVNGIGTTLSVRGNVNLDAVGDGDVGGSIASEGTVYLGGNINRSSANKYGNITMGANSKWIYDGDAAQIIACSEMPNNGNDAFDFTNMEFKNTSGTPMTLEGEIVIEKELILDEGILQTSTTALLVIANNADISGGSDLAYVDGPMKKIGKTATTGFTFPIGDAGIYAPLSVSEISNPNHEYTAQYLSCPPPLSGSLHSSLVSISGVGHWVYNRDASGQGADVTLHWQDAGAVGITDLNDVVIARYDQDSLHWRSIGQSEAVDNGDGSGHVVNALSCPPPLSGSFLTFGSRNGTNALPVVLSAFDARPNGQIVNVSWETSSEVNSDYFVVERSTNGVNFKEIKKVDAASNADQLTKYEIRDINPEKGANYYRLCQVDLMGMKVYSRVLLVDMESDPGYVVFPNPVKDILQVKGDFEAKVYELEFFDTSGKLLTKRAAMAETGFMQLDANELHLPKPGIYFMRVKHGKSLKTIPFIKD